MERARPDTDRLAVPDPNFRLTPEQRASLRRGFDADALERLLAAVEPASRPFILESFQAPRPGESIWDTPVNWMSDPVLQAMLEEVWATAWEQRPELLDDPNVNFPGKEIAKQRRAARQKR